MKLAALIVLALCGAAFADAKSESRQHIRKASVAHAAGKYQEALEELTLAYALDPQPELLYAIGQIHVKLGDCATAVTFYQRFLATKPGDKEAAVAQKAIAGCAAAAAKPVEPATPAEPAKPVEPVKAVEPVTPVVEPPKPVEPPHPVVLLPVTRLDAPAPVVTPPPRDTSADRPSDGWYTDVLGDVLVVGGAAALVVGGIEYSSARTKRDDADHAASYDAYQKAIDQSQDAQHLAIGLSIGGAVLVGLGVVRYELRDSHRSSSVAAVPAPGGGLVTWGGHF